MNAFPPELQVKQMVGEVYGLHGFCWRVYLTGSDQFYLFECVQNTNIRMPVRKGNLTSPVREALAHGWGHAG
jgi:hypothetical protein